MTLEMFMDDNVDKMTDGHIATLMASWKKITTKDKLFEFNRDWYTKFFQKCSDAQLQYYAGLGIPFYSSWASQVLAKRFPNG
jgi:hypothetical protein